MQTAIVNSVNSTIASIPLVMSLPRQALTHERGPGTLFPPVSKGSAERAGAISNRLSFRTVKGFRLSPESDKKRRSAGLNLQKGTVYNLMPLIYNARGE